MVDIQKNYDPAHNHGSRYFQSKNAPVGLQECYIFFEATLSY